MIYLDNNATTLLDPQVFAAMEPMMKNFLGNPSSIHQYGQHAKRYLTDALKKCAAFFRVKSDEIIFTSGATEAINFFISNVQKDGHVITSSLEHAAVVEPLKNSGIEVSYLDPRTNTGSITVEQISAAIKKNTCLIVLSGANNETGIKNDIDAIAKLAAERCIPFLLDGVTLLGKESIFLPHGVSAACFSGHKIHAPLGIGIAIVKKSMKARPLIMGGSQQGGLRAGTENVPAIVGFAKALDLLDDRWIKQMAGLRDHFESGILKNLSDVIIHGKNEARICNTSNMAFLGVDGETLLIALDLAGLAASHGSACSAAAMTTSRVLLNMGIEPSIARCSLRFSLSRFTTQAEIDTSISIITKVVNRLRSI